MDIFIQQVINGLVLGSMYALIALGYTMVYGIINLINFAHGEGSHELEHHWSDARGYAWYAWPCHSSDRSPYFLRRSGNTEFCD